MSVARIKQVLPSSVRRPLGHVRRSIEAPFYFWRAKRILERYSNHHRMAQKVFSSDGNVGSVSIREWEDLGIRIIDVGTKSGFLTLPENYLELVERVSENTRRLLSQSKECAFFPGLGNATLSDLSEDVPEVRDGKILTIQIQNPLQVEGLEALCTPIKEEVEHKIYGSYATVDKVYVYRSPITRQVPQASWLWHFDNHPREVLKVMIYLTDVSDQTAPFEYLRDAQTLRAIQGTPLTPLYGGSRIPEERVAELMSAGCEPHRVTGPKGTTIVFDNNVIHRANGAVDSHRDVLIFQFRPALKRRTPAIDPRWTGSFQHAPFNYYPDDVTPSLERPRHY